MNEEIKTTDIKEEMSYGVEKTRLDWKVGLSIFNKTIDNQDTGRKDQLTIYKAPILLELQIPFSVKMKGLVQTGFGLFSAKYEECQDETEVFKNFH